MVAILGLSAFYHDSAATLVVDGEIVAAAQEERFSRKKNDAGFPTNAVNYCLRQAGIETGDLDYVAFYEKPLLKFERLLETYLAYVPDGFASFRLALPSMLKGKLDLRKTIGKALGPNRAKLVFVEHHESHAASAFFPSPYEDAAILTLDGVGEWATATMGTGTGNRIELTDQIAFPHSLGLLYSAFTYYCGFKVNSGEYKLMGLAPYGKPIHADKIKQELIDIKPDGSFRLNLSYFRYAQGLTMTGAKFHRLFGGPPRSPESSLDQRHMDLAASIQSVTEEVLLRIGRSLHERTGRRHLTLAGGVALNCVANGRLLREGPFDSLWIQPAAGDAGGSLGAALFVWHQLMERPRTAAATDQMKGALLGPFFDDAEIAALLQRIGVKGQTFEDREARDTYVAGLLASEKVVGLFQGRMEFGPRALGARSILGDPRSSSMQATMNLKIKFRESFRPFAPCVLAEHAHEWFELEPGQESPYMLIVAPVLEQHRVSLDDETAATMANDPDLMRRVNVARSTVPAITHVDQSARVQTVDARRNPGLHGLLSAFYELTGCPMLINTSFNVRGEPIVCTPEEAYRCFAATGIDALVLENTVLVKDGAAREREATERDAYLSQYSLD